MQLYEERIREAREDHLAARFARANQREHRDLLRDVVAWLRALPAGAEVAILRRRHA